MTSSNFYNTEFLKARNKISHDIALVTEMYVQRKKKRLNGDTRKDRRSETIYTHSLCYGRMRLYERNSLIPADTGADTGSHILLLEGQNFGKGTEKICLSS
jgi:hypothetical protein